MIPAQTQARHWLIWNVLLFVCIAAVDYFAKRWAAELVDPVTWGPFLFYPYANQGVLGGYFADLDPWIIRIFFSVLFGFLCLAAALLAHFLTHRDTPILKWGLIVYLSGTLGNAWDRTSRGAVVDYILIDFPGLRGTAFNFSDLAVATGFILIAFAIFREKEALWYSGTQRQGHWVDPKFQRGFGLLLVLAGFAHFFVIALYSFTFLKVFIGGGGRDPSTFDPERIIIDYLIGLCILESAALVLTFAVSVLFSHRLVGPVIGLDQWLKRFLEGARAPLRLRRGDYFQEQMAAVAARIEQASPGDLPPKSADDQNPRE